MSTLSAIVNNVSYSLDDGTYCYWTGDDGLGMAPMHRLSERGPLQHGITDRGYRLDPRTVRLVLDITASTQADWESKRSSLLDIFKPSNTAMALELAFSAATYRLDCHYIGQMTMPSSERYRWNQTVLVELLAPDPTFYNPTLVESFFALGGGEDKLEVPMEVPMKVGTTSLNSSKTITYTGDFRAYPIITVYGPITSPVITNATTGDKLDFTGTTIAAGDWYEIDCRYGYKTVVDQDDANVISNLTDDSDIATFSIEPDPDATDGINTLTVTGTSVTAATNVRVAYYTRFLGV
jgi:hypothetical protein